MSTPKPITVTPDMSPNREAYAEGYNAGLAAALNAKPSAPRVVTTEDVERAQRAYAAIIHHIDPPKSGGMAAMRAALESFATSLSAAKVPEGLIQRLEEIREWEDTGVICDGELRKDARALSDRFGQPHAVTIDMAKRDAWKQAADILLAAAPQAGERG